MNYETISADEFCRSLSERRRGKYFSKRRSQNREIFGTCFRAEMSSGKQ